MKTAKKIRVRGIVQGVGFRPFVYKLAKKHEISGYVLNDTEGVFIHAEGKEADIDRFIINIHAEKPEIARIESLDQSTAEVNNYPDFSINESRKTSEKSTFLPPDFSICSDCLEEFFSKEDRRQSYPFITCTNCGPRFSIISDLPYDRKQTAMSEFEMCAGCRGEYSDPGNRRFHTQPNACAICGPRITLRDNRGKPLIENDADKIADRTVELLLTEKAIVAIKGIGGYLLACNGESDEAVKRLRDLKNRPFKPLALMAGNIETVESFLHLAEKEKELLHSIERPVLLLKEKRKRVSRYIAPGLTHIGIMLPYTPFLHQVFSLKKDMVLVMTSGNLSEEPIAFDDADAFKRLGDIADFFVTYNREIIAHTDDSVIFVEDEKPYFIRRSRGYVPVPFRTKPHPRHLIATGGDLKNCFALCRDDIIILSQHMGDLGSPVGYELFRKSFDHFRNVFSFSPDAVITDMHPGYFTTTIARELENSGLKKIPVQHHHAHIASVLEEHAVDDKVIGIAFDGTGYGLDTKLWGSEFLIADKKEFQRAAHFSYFKLPGGERAIHDVWKTGLSLLHLAHGDDYPVMGKSDEADIILQMLREDINSPETCSIGRLFDGVSAIVGVSRTVSTEAEAAMLLEERAAAFNGKSKYTGFMVPAAEGEKIVLDTASLIRHITNLVSKGLDSTEIAYLFHRSIADTTVATAKALREKYSIERVALSGGVFQNRLLLSMTRKGLEASKFRVFTNRKVPANDGCIALGQIAVGKEIV
jgi:hydrogenase maturation protein HypF